MPDDSPIILDLMGALAPVDSRLKDIKARTAKLSGIGTKDGDVAETMKKTTTLFREESVLLEDLRKFYLNKLAERKSIEAIEAVRSGNLTVSFNGDEVATSETSTATPPARTTTQSSGANAAASVGLSRP